MLTSMRNSVGSLGAKILLGLLILAFAAWGVADVFTGQTQTVVAKVGEAEVEASDYARELENRLQSLRQSRGVNLSIEDARRTGFDRIVLAQMTTRTALSEEARTFGLDASDGAVAKTIREAAAFQNGAGQFDEEIYKSRLSYNGLRPSEYENNVRTDLAREGLLQAIGVGTSAPRSLAEALYAYRNEKRSFDYIALSPADTADPGTPDAETLAAFHTDNAPRFTAPEYRKVKVLSLTAEDLGKTFEISDDEVRDRYDDTIAEYTKPERRNIEQIVFDKEDEARKAFAKIEGGEPFAKLAEARGLSAGDVSLGIVQKGDLPDELSEAAFAPEEAGIVEPFGTGLGWYLLNLKSIEREAVTPFEVVRDSLRNRMASERARNLLPEKSVDVDDLLAGGSTLQETAEQSGARFIEIDAIDSSGRDPGGERIAGVPPGAEFLTGLFAAEPGEEPTLTETNEGEYFAFRLEDITEAALRPLDTIEDEVAKAWQDAQRSEALEKMTGELKEKLANGDTLEALAEELGKEITKSGPVIRSDRSVAMSADLMTALFEAEKDDALEGAAATGGGRLVGIVSDIAPATSETDIAAIDRATETYAGAMAQDIVQIYSQSAVDQHPVQPNMIAIERTLSELGQRY